MSKTFELTSNKKITRKYVIENSYEAGLVLTGHLLKKTLSHQVSLTGVFGWIREEELFLRNYSDCDVKLLLHRHEIKRIIRLVKEKKYQLIPTKLYLKNHKVKVEIALAKYNSEIKNKEKLHKLREKSWKNFKLRDE